LIVPGDLPGFFPAKDYPFPISCRRMKHETADLVTGSAVSCFDAAFPIARRFRLAILMDR